LHKGGRHKMKLRTVNGTKCYRIIDIKKELSKEDWKEFKSWIRGQTVMIGNNIISSEQEILVYKYDYDRWRQK